MKIIALFIMCSSLVVMASGSGFGAIIYVDDDGVCDGNVPCSSSVDAGLRAAGDGDTVYVYNGTYYGHLRIDKAVDLQGEHKDSTIIDGQTFLRALELFADGVVVTGFTIANGVIGIQAHSDGNTLSNNKIMDSKIGVSLDTSTGNTIISNDFLNTGIYLFSSYQNTIMYNTVNSKPLVYIEEQNGVLVDSLDSAGQIILVNCENITVQGQDLSNTSVGIELISTNNCLISHNAINANTYQGIKLAYSSGNIITDNDIIEAQGEGIHITSSSDGSKIYHNNFIDNATNAYDECNNTWFDSTFQEGNYWDDYEGYDENGDGIGEEPYQQNGINDLYPLLMEYPMNDIKADLRWVPSYPTELETVVFTDLSSSPQSTILEWRWDMGDGTILYGDSVEYSYDTMGLYYVTLDITDDRDSTDEVVKTLFIKSPDTDKPDLLVIVSPQYKDDPDVLNGINSYKIKVSGDLAWNSATHLIRERDNTPLGIEKIVKCYFELSNESLKAVLLVGEDTNLGLGNESTMGRERPNLWPIATLNMDGTFKVVPSMIFPNFDDSYDLKKEQILFVFNKFSSLPDQSYPDSMRGYNYPLSTLPSDWRERMEVLYYPLVAPFGNVLWRVNPSVAERDQLFIEEFTFLALAGHGNPTVVVFGVNPTKGLRTYPMDEDPLSVHDIITPVMLLGGCDIDGWGGGQINGVLDPPNGYGDYAREWWGHTILTHDILRLVITGVSSGDMPVETITKLARGQTFAEAFLGQPYNEGYIFYGDPSFHYGAPVLLVDDDNTEGPWDGTYLHPYRRIQDAVDSARSEGTVFVYHGTYDENISIDKPVTLIGQDRDSTIISGQGPHDVIDVAADGISVAGFTINNSDYDYNGVSISGHNNTSLMGNSITDNKCGIYISGASSDNTIFENDIVDNDSGVVICSSSNKIYHNNFFTNNQQAYDAGDNEWDNGHPSGGNYWNDFDEPGEGAYDDYHGPDQDMPGGDGIVDLGPPSGGGNPYDIPGQGNQDRYPMVSPFGESPSFVRGDVQADGDHDIFDSIYLLNWLGGLNPEPDCVNACDVQDDEDTDIFDAIYLLQWLGGVVPQPPAPCGDIPDDCGFDPTLGELTCQSYQPCAGEKADKTVFVGRPEESSLSVGEAGGRGRSVSVPVTLTNAEALVGFNCSIEYDSRILTATYVDMAGLITEGFDFLVGGVEEPGVVKIVALSDLDMGNGVERLPPGRHQVARIFFQFNENAPSRDVSLKVTNSVMAVSHDRALSHQTVDGLVRASQRLPAEFQLKR